MKSRPPYTVPGKKHQKCLSPEHRVIQALLMERMHLMDSLRFVLHMYERASGEVHGESGYSARDVEFLARARRKAFGDMAGVDF